MRVLMSADCVGGVWTYAVELSRGLSGRGHEVVLAAMGRELTARQRSEAIAARPRVLATRPYRLEWMPDSEGDVAAAGAWLLDLAERHDVDLVHLNGFAHATLPWRRPVLVAAHSDVVTWWRSVHRGDPPPDWDRYRAAVAAGLDAADVITTPTAAMRDALVAAYSFDTECRVIPNGRSVVHAGPQVKEPLIVSIGRVWDEAKGIEQAARALRDVAWPLVVAGEGHVDGAHCLGPLGGDQVRSLLQRAAIFVEPATYEPFGLGALEAAIAGCALVLGDIPSLREVWGDAATFVTPGDDAALSAAVQGLIENGAALAASQGAASKRAQDYAVEKMVDAYDGLYRDLTSKRVGASR